MVGLDGGTFNVIGPMMAKGRVPNLSALAKEGASGRLESVFPLNSAVAWNSFSSGKYPGKHGVFGFVKRLEGSYRTRPVTSGDRKARTFWQLASDAGKRCCIVNVPLTYPADHINGVMVSGFPYPADSRDYAYPESFRVEMQGALDGVPLLKPSPRFARSGDRQRLAEELNAVTAAQVRLLSRLLEREPWDLVVTVFDATDLAGHFLWGAPNVAGSTDSLYSVYDSVDSALGVVMGWTRHDDLVIVLSDHGFGEGRYTLDMNSWLLDRGFMKLKSAPGTRLRKALFKRGATGNSIFRLARRLGLQGRPTHGYSGLTVRMSAARKVSLSLDDVDWKKTRAYGYNKGGEFFVNLKGREPEGIVRDGAERKAVVEELKCSLKEFQDPHDGHQVFDCILSGNQMYHGPNLQDAPDVVFFDREMNYSPFTIFDFGTSETFAPRRPPSGVHQFDGILLGRGPDIAGSTVIEGARIVDVAPTILAALGLPALSEMDGKAIPQLCRGDSAKEAGKRRISEEEMERIRGATRRLSDSGRGL